MIISVTATKIQKQFGDYKNNLKKSSFYKEIKKFLKQAFSKTNIFFIALIIIFLFLPGSNYYLELKLNPQEPYLKKIPITLDNPAKYPVKKQGFKEPYISANAAVIVDVHSSATLYLKNPDLKLLPASTTKIMTALVTLQHYPLDKVLRVNKADTSIGQTMDLLRGEEITVENLLHGLLMHSGNDAAYTLAENFDGGYNQFVQEMNNLAKQYHLTNTQYRNVSGIDQQGHHTTVADLARLTAVAMKNEIFSKIVGTKEKTVTDVSQSITHYLINKNELLWNTIGIKGVKTGWTEYAKECLVTDTEREGNEIITVILGSDDRFGESKKLIEWTYQAYEWKIPEFDY